MISIEGLKVEFGVKPLFSDATFVINDKDRIALVGKNGAGKSTLLKILCGMEHPTAGNVSVATDTTIGYLPQVMILQDDTTVRQEAQKAFADIQKMADRIKRMEQQLNERTDYESADYMALVEKFTNEHERYQMLGAEGYEAEIERTLMGLGFERKDFERPTSEFSGGWRMRIELAKILLRRPDVLLLDEPTNHLDIESIQWLEQLLATWSGAVVLVSHDRAFINNVSNRTLEITCGQIIDYRVKYDQYVVLRKERREQQLRAYENQQKEMADIRDFVERFRYKPTKAVQVQQRLRQLEKMEIIEVDEVDNSAMHLKFPPCLRSGDYPVICDEVKKAYSHVVFDHVNLTIKRGEKVAFVGKNGEGKSTLVKCIMGEIPFDGTAIIVSHDREFLDGLVTKVFEFGGGKVREHLGGIYDWINSSGKWSAESGKLKVESVNNPSPVTLRPSPSTKQDYAEHKEQQRRVSRAEKAVAESEKKIAKMEQRLKELDSLLCDPKNASDMTLVTEYTDIKRQLDEEVERWEQLSEELEEVKS